jgi:hypothetical protein
LSPLPATGKGTLMRKVRTIGVLAALGALAPLGVLALASSSAGPGPSSALWRAIVAIESGGNAGAFNPHDGATGMAQVRTVCLEDVNRIARLRGLSERFAPADRTDPRAARRIWELYLGYYGDQYRKETGRTPTDEVYARIWNGGPAGWKKSSTVAYWQRVRAAM